jgi:hypothetical protein
MAPHSRMQAKSISLVAAACGPRLEALAHHVSHCHCSMFLTERLGKAALDKISRRAQLAKSADEPLISPTHRAACRR